MKKINLTLSGKKIVEKWRYWISIPCAIILVALVVFSIFAGVKKDAGQGVNIGVDFMGGNVVTIETTYDKDSKKDYDAVVSTAEKVLRDNNLSLVYSQSSTTEKNQLAVVIRFKLMDKDSAVNVEKANAIVDAMDNAFDDNVVKITNSPTGPTTRNDLILTASLSVLFSTLLILIYIIIRFKNIFTGLAAVIALIHDVIIVFALTTIFHIQINSSFVAAIITIIAYSINNTIVLFDRVRENYKAIPVGESVNNDEIVNKSIAQTLSRSILTTVTTMAAIVILAIIGASSIREFALPVIFGLIAGTFSSVFLAPSIYCLMKNASDNSANRNINKVRKPKKEKKAKEIKDTAVV